MKEAATALSGMFEIFIAYMLFSKFGKVKFKKSVSIPVIIAATLLEGVMTLFFSMTPVMSLFFFVSVFIITLIFDLGFPKKLLLCILFLVISVAAETVTVYGVCAISGISLKELKSSGIQYTLSVIISAFLILLIQQVIRRGKNRKTKLPLVFVIGISALPAASMFALFLFFFLIYRNGNEAYYIPTVICSLLLLAANMSTFFIINKQEDFYEEKAELEQTKSMLELERVHYSELFAAQEELKQFRHDSKNLYTSLMASLRENGAESAAELIEKSFNFDGLKNTAYSGNAALDAVISSKIALAKTQQIEIIPYVRIASPIRIDDIDIGILVGNALDNAVEAAARQENREVLLSVITYGDMLSVEVKNSVCADFEIGSMKTTKPDASNHGYGLKSIEAIAEKHSGTLSVKAENGEFVLSVILCNDKI